MPAESEPLAITITTLPEPPSEPVLDPNITLTSESEEETYELAEDNHMEVALMSRPTKFKAGLPEDFSGKNDDTTRWLLAMKAYFVINKKVYTKDTTTVLIFINKLSVTIYFSLFLSRVHSASPTLTLSPCHLVTSPPCHLITLSLTSPLCHNTLHQGTLSSLCYPITSLSSPTSYLWPRPHLVFVLVLALVLVLTLILSSPHLVLVLILSLSCPCPCLVLVLSPISTYP